MNISIKSTCTCQIITCRKCHCEVAEHGSVFCAGCNRALFPQDYECEAETEVEPTVYRRVDVDLFIEVVDLEERGALRSDSQRDDR